MQYTQRMEDLSHLTLKSIRENRYKQMEKIFVKAFEKINYETKKVALSTHNGIWMVNIKNIIRIEGAENYSKVFFTTGETVLICKTLKNFEELLGNYQFERVHKSHLVNLNYISRYFRNDGSYILMQDQTKVLVSKPNRSKLITRLELM